jgi:hypothetical protein
VRRWIDRWLAGCRLRWRNDLASGRGSRVAVRAFRQALADASISSQVSLQVDKHRIGIFQARISQIRAIAGVRR